MSFVHLHVHSHYSLLDGVAKISDLVKRAKEAEMGALALTDHGVMYGAIEFYKECKKQGLKPIIGMEGYISPRALHLKKSKIDEKNCHITLLAANQEGYRNLMFISSVAHVDGFYYKPRLDLELLRERNHGIICLSGCVNGQIPKAVRDGNLSLARELVQRYSEAVEPGNFYLEVMPADVAGRQSQEIERVNRVLVDFAREFKLPIVATADVHYLEPTDQKIQEILLCVGTGTTLSDPKRFSMEGNNCSFRTEEEMRLAFPDMPEAIDESGKIADRIDLQLDLKTWHFPPYEKTPSGRTLEEHFTDLAYRGAEHRLGSITSAIKERLDYELDVILTKGYHSYFLVVADFMTWARERGIITTARGSIAGSLVAYSLNITMVNPLFFQLPFERFLTKERPSPPDIDCDIQDSRRGEIIQYIKETYGRHRVAQICTFGTLLPRAAVRDIARALGQEYSVGDRIAKAIPFGSQGFPMTVARAKQESQDLKAMYALDPIVHEVIDYAERVEGNPRHVSIHAAGLIITPGVLTDYTPLQLDPKHNNEVVTQYDMYALDPNAAGETVGLLKMDLLGLRNLNILDLARKIIRKRKEVEVDLYNLPLDDKKTFKLFADGHTVGIFQMSGEGMTKYLKDLKPTNIFNITAMVALYRPGPIEYIPRYIQCKNNPSLITYLDPRLEPILKNSYGVLTYQDDVLLIAVQIAGYTWQEADKLRKAMGKKIPEEMAKQKDKFISGCIAGGMSAPKAKELFALIEPFAAYGFNKAHAASYGFVAYQTAYLKANYPAEFMTAVMVAEQGNMDTIAEAIQECSSLGIRVLPPDVNSSLVDFTYILDTEIRFGLTAVKNLGEDIARSLINERKANGEYRDLTDFLMRLKNSTLNKKSLESLIKSGALDCFGERGVLLSNVDGMLNFLRRQKSGATNQVSLFALEAPVIRLKQAPPATPEERLAWEKELLGIYLTGHPFADQQKQLGESGLPLIRDVKPNGPVVIGVHLQEVKKIITKSSKEQMVFGTASDTSGQIEIVVFPKTYAVTVQVWRQGCQVLLKGRAKQDDEGKKFIVDTACPLAFQTLSEDIARLKSFASNGFGTGNGNGNGGTRWQAREVTIRFANPTPVRQQQLKEVLERNPGDNSVVFMVESSSGVRRIITQYHISLNAPLIGQIETIAGLGNVTVNGNGH